MSAFEAMIQKSHPHAVATCYLRSPKRKEKKRKEKTTPFGVNLMRSQLLYRAAKVRSPKKGSSR